MWKRKRVLKQGLVNSFWSFHPPLVNQNPRYEPIEAQYAKLIEFEVTPPETEISTKNNLRTLLEEFRNSCSEADNILGKSKKVMRGELEADLLNFAQVVRDVKSEFYAIVSRLDINVPTQPTSTTLWGFVV